MAVCDFVRSANNKRCAAVCIIEKIASRSCCYLFLMVFLFFFITAVRVPLVLKREVGLPKAVRREWAALEKRKVSVMPMKSDFVHLQYGRFALLLPPYKRKMSPESTAALEIGVKKSAVEGPLVAVAT